jgi:hypothetical protein
MAKKSAKRTAAEPVPLDDPAVEALVARAASLGDSMFAPVLRTWLSANSRQRDSFFAALQQWLVRETSAAATVPLLFELLPLVDEPRVLQLLTTFVAMFAGDHRNWLGATRFDAERVVAGDAVRAANHRALVAMLPALAPLAVDRSPDVRARFAFVAAWLGEDARDTVVSLLAAQCRDPEPVVRAHAVVALSMHEQRATLDALRSDPDERVRCCAAIAASSNGGDEAALDALEPWIAAESAPWPELAFNNGALSEWAAQRCGAMYTRFQDRVGPALLGALSSKTAPVVRAAFAGWERGAEFTALQRAVVARVIADEAMQTIACIQELREAGLVSNQPGITTADLFDELRARFDLPRPPPLFGPKALVSVDDTAKYAQHWLADYALDPQPDRAALIARAIAETIETDALVELLLRFSVDLDGSVLPFERVADRSYDVAPLPGFERAGERWIGAPEQWPQRVRDWIAEREREGWLVAELGWLGFDARFALFDLRGRHLLMQVGHEWTMDGPNYSQTRALVWPRHRLTPLVARAARERDSAAFDAVIARWLETGKKPAERWVSGRVARLAVELFAGTSAEPPALYDEALRRAQVDWGGLLSHTLAYGAVLSDARREALALSIAAETRTLLPQLYALSRSRAVFDALAPRLREQGAAWAAWPESQRRSWAMVMGDEAADELVQASSEGAPRRRTKRR